MVALETATTAAPIPETSGIVDTEALGRAQSQLIDILGADRTEQTPDFLGFKLERIVQLRKADWLVDTMIEELKPEDMEISEIRKRMAATHSADAMAHYGKDRRSEAKQSLGFARAIHPSTIVSNDFSRLVNGATSAPTKDELNHEKFQGPTLLYRFVSRTTHDVFHRPHRMPNQLTRGEDTVRMLIEYQAHMRMYAAYLEQSVEPEVQDVLNRSMSVLLGREDMLFGASLAQLDRILAYDPDHERALSLRAEINAHRKTFVSSDIHGLLADADRHIKSSERHLAFRCYSQAQMHIRGLLTEFPEDEHLLQMAEEIKTGLDTNSTYFRTWFYEQYGLKAS